MLFDALSRPTSAHSLARSPQPPHRHFSLAVASPSTIREPRMEQRWNRLHELYTHSRTIISQNSTCQTENEILNQVLLLL